MNVILWVVAAAAVIGIIALTVNAAGKQQREMDSDPSATAIKHPILANRVFMVYIIGLVIVFAGALTWALFLV